MEQENLMHPPTQSLANWFRVARAPYLNFLRNLTPQIFLASMAWLIATKINFNAIDLGNWIPTLGFYMFIAMFAYSFYANATLFFEDAFADLNGWVSDQKVLRKSKCNLIKQPLFFRIVLRERKVELLIAVIAMVALEFVFADVVGSSIATTVNLLKLAHP